MQLSVAPGTLGLMMRAGLPLIPGASALSFVAGGGSELPDLELTLAGARLSRERLAAYARVCGFALDERLPASAPHLLAFPLQMALMSDGSFPFPAVGLVHVSNRIVLHRPIAADQALDLSVRALALEAHPRGATFTIVTEARIAQELVWEEHSTMLHRDRGKGSPGAGPAGAVPAAARRPACAVAGEHRAGDGDAAPEPQPWMLAGNLGRRYAAVSGDRNPIHMHALSARLFGFPRAIAHGMWTKARCLAALGAALPDSYAVEVDFRKPILLPGRVCFLRTQDREHTRFFVRSTNEQGPIHLEGTVTR